jgi:sugar lactone lactonase YvrE
LLAVALLVLTTVAAHAQPTLLVDGLAGGSGSTVGPDGALYVTEGAAGRVSRVDPQTGEVTTFASGLPPFIIGVGGAMDVTFIGNTAYVLVTLVATDLNSVVGPGTVPEPGNVVGIYRIDGPDSYTVIADIGAYNLANPPSGFNFFVPTGVQYSIEVFRHSFLVTDGHLNRVLRVTLDGEITEFMTFGNIVPTGLAVRGNTVYMAQAGSVPHAAADGRIVTFEPGSTSATELASGAPLMVDVQFGRGRKLYGLAQGIWNGQAEGSPAFPNTGQLVEVHADGTITVLAEELNIPTSMQVIDNDAYIVSLTGQIWKIENVSQPPFGR